MSYKDLFEQLEADFAVLDAELPNMKSGLQNSDVAKHILGATASIKRGVLTLIQALSESVTSGEVPQVKEVIEAAPTTQPQIREQGPQTRGQLG